MTHFRNTETTRNIDAVGLITARQGIEFGTRPGLGASISDLGNAVFAGVVTATSFSGSGADLTGISGGITTCLLYTSDAADE